MNEDIKRLEAQVKWMQEILIALIILQDPMTKIKLRWAYPALDDMLKKMWVWNI